MSDGVAERARAKDSGASLGERLRDFLLALLRRTPASSTTCAALAAQPSESARMLGADCGWLPHRLRQVWVEPAGEAGWRAWCEDWHGATRRFDFADGPGRQGALADALVTQAGFKSGHAAITAKWIFESIGHRGPADWFAGDGARVD